MVQKIVIIGGSSGIGLATAKAAQKAEFDVLIASRSRDRLLAAVRQVGKRCQGQVLDVTDEAAVQSFFDQLGKFDHLVVTISDNRLGAFGQMPTATARSVFDTRFWGQYVCARSAAKKVKQSITLFSGIASIRPFPGMHAAAAANGAIEALARSMAVELAPVRVNVVAPGLVDTPAYASLPEAERTKMFEEVGRKLPARRIGKVDDVAQTVLHIVASPYMTGVVVPVDGGHRLVW